MKNELRLYCEDNPPQLGIELLLAKCRRVPLVSTPAIKAFKTSKVDYRDEKQSQGIALPTLLPQHKSGSVVAFLVDLCKLKLAKSRIFTGFTAETNRQTASGTLVPLQAL